MLRSVCHIVQERSTHVADGELRDAYVGGLGAGEDDGSGDFGWVHHVGVADELFGTAVVEGELGFDSTRAEDADLDVELAEFRVEGLAEADLGEFAGAVDGLAGGTL